MLTKFHVKDYSQHKQHNKGRIRAFGGNNVEIAPKSFGFCETINPDPECVIKEMFFLDQIDARTHTSDNPIGKRLYGSQSDLAAEFNICFQFQVHMAHCINSSR